MRTLVVVRDFLRDLKSQRLRTALTILGITWGTVAVVVLLAFGAGLGDQTKKNARGLGENLVILSGGRTVLPYRGFGEGRQIRLTEEDAEVLSREIPQIGEISPEYGGRPAPARRGTSVTNPYITGVVPVYSDIRNVIAAAGGRFINQHDVDQRRRVVVLGDEVREILFGDDDPVGKTIMLGETPFLVIGEMVPKTQNSSYNSRDANRIFIPSSTYATLFGARYISQIIYRATDPELSPAVQGQVFEVLGRRHVFDPSDRDALSLWDTTEMERLFRYIFLGFNIFLGVVGSFTLTVGGIGVANIMYVVVRERTREIGIKRSLGATRRDIMLQFFLEGLLIVLAGAGLGFLISWGIVEALGMLPIEDEVGVPTISPTVVLVTATLLGIITFTAGLFPARRAANLDPVDCLREA